MHSGEFTYLEKMMMIAVLPDNKLIAVFNLVIENERLVLFFFFFLLFFFPKDISNDNSFLCVAWLVIFSR